jgi:hypothetical protein
MADTSTDSERWILSTRDELRDGVLQIAKRASRSLTILTPDLETGIYDTDEFLEIVKHLVLRGSYARVRVLISDPVNAVRNGNRFVELGRKLHSYIEFRNLHEKYRSCTQDAYIIADDVAIIYRKDASRPDGVMGLNEQAVAREQLRSFEQPWEESVFRHALPTD